MNVYKDVSVTVKKGKNYSKPDQKLLFNATKGQFYNIADGAANVANIDFVFTLLSDNPNETGLLIFPPSKFLTWDKFWGDLTPTIAAQNWSEYKATKISYFNETSYPPAVWWDKLITINGVNSLVSKSFSSIGSNYFNVINQGNAVDNRLFVLKLNKGNTASCGLRKA